MDQLLQMLRIKGRATPETLGVPSLDDDVAATIERCEAEGLVENTRLGYRITDLGKKRVDELYDDERGKAAAVIDDVYDSFIPINDEIKQIVTDWQMRIVGGQIVLNDHSDPAHDEQVIARLHDTDAQAAPALASLVKALPRFDSYSAPLGPGARTRSATATTRWWRRRSRTATTPCGSSSTRSSSSSPVASARSDPTPRRHER